MLKEPLKKQVSTQGEQLATQKKLVATQKKQVTTLKTQVTTQLEQLATQKKLVATLKTQVDAGAAWHDHVAHVSEENSSSPPESSQEPYSPLQRAPARKPLQKPNPDIFRVYDGVTMTSWGKNGVPYPLEVFDLALRLLSDGLNARQVRKTLVSMFAVQFPGKTVNIPSTQAIGDWTYCLLPSSNFLAAVVILIGLAEGKAVIMHPDGTTREQLKFGACPVRVGDDVVVLDGVLLQSSGTAQEGADSQYAAFVQVQTTLDMVRTFLVDHGVDVSFLPKGDLLHLVAVGVRVTMSDHATTQTKQTREFEKRLADGDVVGDAEGDGSGEGAVVEGNAVKGGDVVRKGLAVSTGCHDHKQHNTCGALDVVNQRWLEKTVGMVRDPGEFSTTNIVGTLLREIGKMVGVSQSKKHAYSLGDGRVFYAWLADNYPGRSFPALKAIVGNRYFAYMSNAATVFYLREEIV
jgi:hypothetical protein